MFMALNDIFIANIISEKVLHRCDTYEKKGDLEILNVKALASHLSIGHSLPLWVREEPRAPQSLDVLCSC